MSDDIPSQAAIVSCIWDNEAGHYVDISSHRGAELSARTPYQQPSNRLRGARDPQEMIDEIAALKAELATIREQRDEWQRRYSAAENKAAKQAAAYETEVHGLKDLLREAGRSLKAFLHLAKPDADDIENGRKDALEGLPDSHTLELTWAPDKPGNYITVGQIRRARAIRDKIRKEIEG